MNNNLDEYMNQVNKEVSKKIIEARKSLGMTKVELARRAGVSVPQLVKYESCINRMSMGRLTVIAKALGKRIFHFDTEISKEDSEIIEMLGEIEGNPSKIKLIKQIIKLDNKEQLHALCKLLEGLHMCRKI